VLLVLAAFVALGAPVTETEAFEPSLPRGWKGLFSATAVVFVSYAGVTKIASVAEEVKRPGRTIPLGMLASIGLVILLYPAIVGVMVGVTPAAELAASLTPVTTAAEQFLGRVGVLVISATAVLALISMANAGLTASARYPFAMSRNQLAPHFLQRIGSRSGVPTTALISTGAVLVSLIVFVPILELAKLASAFQLLVFAFVNLALIAFRESRLDWYRPSFRSPLYPWVQVFGIVASLLLLTQIGLLASVGATLFVIAGALWYRGFGQRRASRESAARDALRAREENRLIAGTRAAVQAPGRNHILIAIRRPTRPERQQNLMRLALQLVRSPGGRIHVLHFDRRVPSSTPTPLDRHRAEEMGIYVTVEFDPQGNRRGAVHLYAEREGVDLVLADLPQELRATRHIVRDWRWLRDHLPSDSAFLRNRHIDEIDTIVVMGTGGPYDPVKIALAAGIARVEGSRIRFIHVAQESASEEQMAAIGDYHRRLGETLDVPWDSWVEPAEDLVETLTWLSRGANLVILGAPSHRFHQVTDLADRIAESVDCPALLVHTPRHERPSLARRLIERLIS
jgi:nucleotide-binding universal stress UspA family protein